MNISQHHSTDILQGSAQKLRWGTASKALSFAGQQRELLATGMPFLKDKYLRCSSYDRLFIIIVINANHLTLCLFFSIFYPSAIPLTISTASFRKQ